MTPAPPSGAASRSGRVSTLRRVSRCAFIVAILPLLALTACTYAPPPAGPTAVPHGGLGPVAERGPAAGRSASAATSPADPVAAHLDEVTGTGRLTGPITGSFTITYQDRSPTLHLRDLDVHGSPARTFQFAADLASATCRDDDVGLLHGTVSSARTQDIGLRDPAFAGLSDLSYFRALAIWPAADRDSCTPDRVSAGTITWTLPAAIRDLAATDRGAAAGAHGDVTTVDGRPSSYRVAPDDQVADVLARFDLTLDDLLYLNPFRDRDETELLADERLDLDALHRRP